MEEIKQLIPNVTWQHSQSSDNPADLLTRGLTINQFNTSSLWWHGPHWLLDERKWPSWDPQSVSQLYVAALIAEEFVISPPAVHNDTKIITPHNYSSLERLLAVTAYVQCFTDNLKRSQNLRMTGPLTSKELNTARLQWIKTCQEGTFANELLTLKPQQGTKHRNKTW